jgi:hypothetical protein
MIANDTKSPIILLYPIQWGLPATSIEKTIQSPSSTLNREGFAGLGNQGISARNITIAVRIPGLTLRAFDVFLDDICHIVIELTFCKFSADKELTDIATNRQQKDSQKNRPATHKTEDKIQFKFAHKS